MAKIFAWLLFGTSVACFATCFCRQQLEVAVAESADAYSQPTEQWTRMMRNQAKFADWPDGQNPTTRPAPHGSFVTATVAAGDLRDAAP